MKREIQLISLLFVLGLIISISFTPSFALENKSSSFEYIGTKSCKKCHIKQWKSWKDTNMAKAFDTLKKGEKMDVKSQWGIEDKDYTEDPKCLKCHTVGFGTATGYRVLSETDLPEDEKERKTLLKKMSNLQGVGCENCHGPGSAYAKTMKEHKKDYKRADIINNDGMQEINKDTCLHCHNAESPTIEKDSTFDYEKKKDEGPHEHFKMKYEH